MNEFVPDQSSTGQAEGASAEAQPQVTSLDSLSEFEFQGERMTPDRLQEIIQGHRTLSERVKQSQSEDRYWANLDTDIENVMANPALADKFKSIYPEKFHRVLDRILGQSAQKTSQPTQALPKEFLTEFGTLKNSVQQMAIEAANAKLDALLPKIYEKYPLANEDQVLAKAEIMLSNGMKLSDQSWEKLAKESHEAMKKKSDAFYKTQLQAQVDKGLSGKDAPSGGLAPGKAPQKFKTFDDAREGMIAHLKGQGWT